MAKYWYTYSGGSQTTTSIVTLANYTKIGSTHPSGTCPGSTAKICQIYATGTATDTIPISFGIRTVGYITTAFNTMADQPSTPGAYAYVRS